MANTRGRQVVLLLTNKSGGSVAAGDVVVFDTTTDESFTTTTTGRAELSVGVAQETIANNAVGRVLVSGYAALVNVPASVTRGHYIETHTVVKQATGNSTRRSGSFGQFAKTSATPSAWLWGSTDDTSALGTWTSYTPTLTASTTNPTIGNGTLTGRYRYLDASLIHIKVSWTFGSTSAAGSGEYSFALPVASTATMDTALAAWFIDNGTAYYAASGHIYSGGSVINPIAIGDATGTRGLGHAVPVAWATGDKVVITGLYEV